MKHAKLIPLLIIPLFLMVTPFAVDPVKGQTQTEVTFWYTENDAEAPGVRALVAAFEAANPDIDVIDEQKGFFSARNTYIVQYTGKQEPMVFRAARDWVVEFAYQDLIHPVEDYYTEAEWDEFLESALRLVKYADEAGDEHIYGFPHLIDSPALLFNKHYFEEAGIDTSAITPQTSWTWDEFLTNAALLGALNDEDGEPIDGFTFQGMFYGGQPAYYGHGARFFDDGILDRGHMAIDSTESRDAIQFIKDIVDEDWSPGWDDQGWETVNAYFETGQVAMIQQGPWELRNFIMNSIEFNAGVEDARSYASEDNLGIMRLPHDEDGNEGAPLGGHAFIISNRAEGDVLDASVKLAKFMSSEYAMKAGAIDYYHVPARSAVFDDVEVQSSGAWKYIEVFNEIVDRSIQVPVSHLWATLETIFAQELESFLADEQTLNVMLARTNELWGDILPAGVTVIESLSTYVSDGTTYTITVSITSSLEDSGDDDSSPFGSWGLVGMFVLAVGGVRARRRKRRG